MSEIILNRLKENKGKEITIFLLNGFRFTGKVTNFDNAYIEILDKKTNQYKCMAISQIADIDWGLQ